MFERTIARLTVVELPDPMGDAGAGDPHVRLRLDMRNRMPIGTFGYIFHDAFLDCFDAIPLSSVPRQANF